MSVTRSDRGEGAIGAAVGVVAFLSVLLLVVQLLAGLYAGTTVDAVTYDAARIIAEGGDEGSARAHVATLLGQSAVMRTVHAGDHVRVEVTVPGPHLLGLPHPFRSITRSAEIRIERPQAAP